MAVGQGGAGGTQDVSDVSLTVEIITPRGVFLAEEGLEQVVMRRREERFEQGSEVAVRSRHGRMLVRLPKHTMRLDREGGSRYVEIDGGFAEIRRDVVSVLTTGAREVDRGRAWCPPQGATGA